MVTVKASIFAKNFGLYREIAQREPVEITSHDRPIGYLLSAAEFEQYRQLKELQPKALYVHELPSEDLDELMKTRMDSRHDHLNALLDNN